MDWQALAGRAEAFLRDENGGESLEYAITSVIAVTTAAATAVAAQQALNERICAFAENSLGPPTRPE
jgi:Flp pilus assembly pilin Flp